jgi:putative drug exporter of the RND superfamily
LSHHIGVTASIGSTIMLGLVFDTLVVRSFMTPSIAALLGRWFWWPRRVRTYATPAGGDRATGDTAATQPLAVNTMNTEGQQ